MAMMDVSVFIVFNLVSMCKDGDFFHAANIISAQSNTFSQNKFVIFQIQCNFVPVKKMYYEYSRSSSINDTLPNHYLILF